MLKRIERNQKILLARTEPGNMLSRFNPKEWVTTPRAVDELGASLRTLERRRADKTVRWTKDDGVILYNLSDIQRIKRRYMR